MLNILVVEDKSIVGSYIAAISKNTVYKIKLHRASAVDEAYKIAEEEVVDAFFIDANLGVNKESIELGKKLRKLDKYKRAIIIYHGGGLENELEAYRTTFCYHYLLEPYSIDDIVNLLDNMFTSEEKFNTSKLKLDCGGNSRFIKYEDIKYIELKNRKIYVITKYEQIEYKRCAISKVLKQLAGNFIRVHQSYIVNQNYIEMIDWKNSIIKISDTHEEISIGRTYIPELRGKESIV